MVRTHSLQIEDGSGEDNEGRNERLQDVRNGFLVLDEDVRDFLHFEDDGTLEAHSWLLGTFESLANWHPPLVSPFAGEERSVWGRLLAVLVARPARLLR